MPFRSMFGLAAVVFAGLLFIGVAANVSGRFGDRPAATTQQAAPNPMPSVADQQKCTDQADSFFQREGSRLSRQGATTGYTNQYSPRLGKCFITIITSEYSQSSREFSFYKMSIYDALSGTPYGSYTSSKTSDSPEDISECWVTRKSGEDYHCGSQAQWKAAAADYQ